MHDLGDLPGRQKYMKVAQNLSKHAISINSPRGSMLHTRGVQVGFKLHAVNFEVWVAVTRVFGSDPQEPFGGRRSHV